MAWLPEAIHRYFLSGAIIVGTMQYVVREIKSGILNWDPNILRMTCGSWYLDVWAKIES